MHYLLAKAVRTTFLGLLALFLSADSAPIGDTSSRGILERAPASGKQHTITPNLDILIKPRLPNNQVELSLHHPTPIKAQAVEPTIRSIQPVKIGIYERLWQAGLTPRANL